MNGVALLRMVGGLPAGLGGAVAVAVAAKSAFYIAPMQLPFLTGAVVDVLTGKPASVYGWPLTDASQALTVIGVALGAVALAQGVAACLDDIAMTTVGDRVATHLRSRAIAAWIHAAPNALAAFDPADVVQRSLHEAATARDLVVSWLVELPVLALRVVFPVAALLTIDARLAVIPLIVPGLQWALAQPLRSRVAALAEEMRPRRVALAAGVRATFEGLETTQAHGAETDRLARVGSALDAVSAGGRRGAWLRGGNRGMAWGLTTLGLALVWWQGGLRVLSGSLSPGELVAFAGFVRFLNLPTRRFAQITARQGQGMASLKRLAELHRGCTAGVLPAGADLRVGSGDIVLRMSRTGRRDADPPLHATFSAGTLHYVIGGSGSGKTALLRTLAGMAPLGPGQVLIDGQDLVDCSVSSVRYQVRMVPEEPFIVPGTVRDNLLIGRPDPGDEAVFAACRAAAVEDTVRRLPLGLDTPLATGDVALSVSERRRLTLARAFLSPPRVLLLDEPTAGLDAASARRVVQTLHELATTATVIVAAHAPPHDVVVRRFDLDDAPSPPTGADVDARPYATAAELP